MSKSYKDRPDKFKYQIAKKKKGNNPKKYKTLPEYDLGPLDNGFEQ